MMVSLGGTGIVVATEAVDFRKGHDGLAALVQNGLSLDPYSGAAYVFAPSEPTLFHSAYKSSFVTVEYR